MAFSLSSLHDLKIRYVLRSPFETALNSCRWRQPRLTGLTSPRTVIQLASDSSAFRADARERPVCPNSFQGAKRSDGALQYLGGVRPFKSSFFPAFPELLPDDSKVRYRLGLAGSPQDLCRNFQRRTPP